MTAERDAMRQYARDCGLRLKTVRKLRRFRQVDLAERLKVSQGTIVKWERGQRLPRDYWRARIAEELEVDSSAIYPAPEVRVVAAS